MGEAAEDLWHVRLGPDDVKRLSLEQLDDLFRLDVISADTQVWQEGMEEWLPLSVVAGLGDEEPQSVSIPVSQPPPAIGKRGPTTTQMGWPPAPPRPSSSRPPSAVKPSAPPQPSRTTGVVTRPPPPSARSNPPLVPTMSSWPPDAAWSDPPRASVAVSGFAPTLAAGSTPFSAPLAPSAAVFEDTAPRARRGGSGGWVIVVAAVVGLVVTLYRNDVVHAAASSMGQTATILKLESALGGPGFGTPRAVSKMTTRPKVEADSIAAPTPTTAPAVTSTPTPTTTPEPVAEAPRSPTPEPQKATTPAAPRAETTPASARTPRSSAASPASRSGGAGVTDPDNVFKQPKKGKKGNEYDPLNPSL